MSHQIVAWFIASEAGTAGMLFGVIACLSMVGITARILIYLRQYGVWIFLTHFEKHTKRVHAGAAPLSNATWGGETKLVFEEAFHDAFHTRNKKARPRAPRLIVFLAAMPRVVKPFLQDAIHEIQRLAPETSDSELRSLTDSLIANNRGLSQIGILSTARWSLFTDLLPGMLIMAGAAGTLVGTTSVAGTLAGLGLENLEKARVLADGALWRLAYCLGFTAFGVLLAFVLTFLNAVFSTVGYDKSCAALLYSGLTELSRHLSRRGRPASPVPAASLNDVSETASLPLVSQSAPPRRAIEVARTAAPVTPSAPKKAEPVMMAPPKPKAPEAPPSTASLPAQIYEISESISLRSDIPIFDEEEPTVTNFGGSAGPSGVDSTPALPQSNPFFSALPEGWAKLVDFESKAEANRRELPDSTLQVSSQLSWEAELNRTEVEKRETPQLEIVQRISLLENYLLRAREDYKAGKLTETIFREEIARWTEEKERLAKELALMEKRTPHQAA